MDFEILDNVDATELKIGDIVCNGEQEFLEITGNVQDDGSGLLVYRAFNLDTNDDDDTVLCTEWEVIPIYTRSYGDVE